MTISKIMKTIENEGCWVGKLNYYELQEVSKTGLKTYPVEGGKYKVEG